MYPSFALIHLSIHRDLDDLYTHVPSIFHHSPSIFHPFSIHFPFIFHSFSIHFPSIFHPFSIIIPGFRFWDDHITAITAVSIYRNQMFFGRPSGFRDPCDTMCISDVFKMVNDG